MSIETRVQEIWKDLHAIPEKSGSEEKTSAYLADLLGKAGFEVQSNVAGYGVIGTLRGNDPGPVLGMVANTDALLHVIDGKEQAMHTCGHDANCAMVMAAAEAAAATAIKKGTLKIIFQPAEETLVGALELARAGVVDDVDILIAAHLRPIQEAKMGQVTPALWHGASTMIRAKITGHIAHGARPHLGINPVDAAAAVINGINSIHVNPSEPWSIKTTGVVSNGKVTNAVPDIVEMTFDARSQSNTIMKDLVEKAKHAIETAAAVNGAKGEVTYCGGVPAADFDDEVTQLISEAIVEELGQEALIAPIVTPGGDDFHFYKQERPKIKAGFFGVGADLTPGLHDPAMCFNPEALKDGTKIFVNLINRILN